MRTHWILIVGLLAGCAGNETAETQLNELTEPEVLAVNNADTEEEEQIAPGADAGVWTISEDAKGLTEVNIQWVENAHRHEEMYRLKNNEPIYAKESTYLLDDHGGESFIWDCEYTIKNGKIARHSSNGQGKTEKEGWDPNWILEQWKRRKPVYLKKLLEESKK